MLPASSGSEFQGPRASQLVASTCYATLSCCMQRQLRPRAIWRSQFRPQSNSLPCHHVRPAAHELAALEGVLRPCNIAQPVKDYIIKTSGASSVLHFYGKVSEGAFEQEIVTLILDEVASAKDNPLQTSSLRAAWRAAKAIVRKTESHKK